MPREHRRSSNSRADNRPSFARPPGAAPARPAETYSPRDKRRSRVAESRRYNDFDDNADDDTQDDDEEEDEIDEESDHYAKSPTPIRRSGAPTRDKAKSSPAVSPQKERKRKSRDPGRDSDRERREDRDRHRTVYHSSNPTRHKRKTSAPVHASPRAEREKDKDRVKYSSGTSTGSASQLLSSDALAKLNAHNQGERYEEQRKERKQKEREKSKQYKNLQGVESAEKKRRKKNRNVSGAILEEGRGQSRVKKRGGGGGGGGGRVYEDEDEYDEKAYVVRKNTKPRRKWNMTRKKWLFLALLAVLLIIIIAVAAVVSNKKKGGGGGGGSSGGGSASLKNTCDPSGVPAGAKGSYTDISTWLDTTDFNCTYTSEEVGGLSVMGLNSAWDDSKSANSNTPPLNKAWDYSTMPARGVNVGGWLNLEPFITPSMFNQPSSQGVVDEYTMSAKLGAAAARTLEQHYATFITKQDFSDIAAAGLDHVRIPFGYWAVTTYDGDPFVPKISWRYLLRAIEYCRQNGLRVNLDLHAAPGSQNGWAHSGHQGTIGWLAGANGDTNAQRTLDIHNQLSQFFAQDRYKNVVVMYGLINEPYMLTLDHNKVLDWNKKAIDIVRKNGIKQEITFHDGFLALKDWSDMFKNVDNDLIMDTHQYQIFNVGQLKLPHADKIKVACSGWAGMIGAANNPSTGWGPLVCGEWSQADTDCTPNLNNVTAGNRWTGTLNTGVQGTSVLTPSCPSPPCSCDSAVADAKSYSDSYKKFLKMFAEAQIYAFEKGRGWFYWTWKTESATQWSWKSGRAAGILPDKAYAPSFRCDSTIPSFSDLSESY